MPAPAGSNALFAAFGRIARPAHSDGRPRPGDGGRGPPEAAVAMLPALAARTPLFTAFGQTARPARGPARSDGRPGSSDSGRGRMGVAVAGISALAARNSFSAGVGQIARPAREQARSDGRPAAGAVLLALAGGSSLFAAFGRIARPARADGRRGTGVRWRSGGRAVQVSTPGIVPDLFRNFQGALATRTWSAKRKSRMAPRHVARLAGAGTPRTDAGAMRGCRGDGSCLSR